MNDLTHSLAVRVTDEQYDRMRDLIPQGRKKSIFSAIIDDLIKALELNRDAVMELDNNNSINFHSLSELIERRS